MSEWSSRPRQTPFAGHRKATLHWCPDCRAFHRTHRHADGEERCAAMDAAREDRRRLREAGPHIRAPKAERARVNLRPPI